jgi:hypothetical protein
MVNESSGSANCQRFTRTSCLARTCKVVSKDPPVSLKVKRLCSPQYSRDHGLITVIHDRHDCTIAMIAHYVRAASRSVSVIHVGTDTLPLQKLHLSGP